MAKPDSNQDNDKVTGYRFSSQKNYIMPGYGIESHVIRPVHSQGGVYDFDGDARGRVIFHTPTQSDTIYFNKPEDWADHGQGFIPVGRAKDQEASKKWFYKFAEWAIPSDSEESKAAHRRAVVNKKHIGGTMNRINYFQQGGAAPQQDMQQQVVALVQAAMQGDPKATETVNKIMEAAKAGDQQAMQIAQMIQQVAEQMKGQATAAKWGAKLNYIRSLKYAKGGKACPACEKAKQVEMKACGGKKAKKRYFGGLI